MFVVDTNVLVYAANSSSPEHQVCHDTLQRWRRQSTPWYLTWSVCYEFLRVVTHRRVLPSPWSAAEARGFVQAVLDSPSARVLLETPRHADVLTEVLRETPGLRGNDLHDVHIATVMREHGVREVVTRDTGFHRFAFLTVTDPLDGAQV